MKINVCCSGACLCAWNGCACSLNTLLNSVNTFCSFVCAVFMNTLSFVFWFQVVVFVSYSFRSYALQRNCIIIYTCFTIPTRFYKIQNLQVIASCSEKKVSNTSKRLSCFLWVVLNFVSFPGSNQYDVYKRRQRVTS